ncbi:MAG: CHASE3 domain-containing protein [Nitrospira sp.]|nr:CHASE3 domain-containing protein [Nitrospira sp.]
MDIRGRFIGFLIVVTAALALSFFGHLFLFDHWRMQHERQLHRSKILEEVLRLQRLVMDVETNFRGYLLTEQPSFLEPINQAESRLEAGMVRLRALTTSIPGLQAGVGVLSARLREFVESKKALVATVRMDKQEQVHLYVRGGSGRALFLTIEKAIGDFETRIQRELPHEAISYESWMQRARWQLLILESLGIMLCVYLTRVLGFSKKSFIEGRSFQVLP